MAGSLSKLSPEVSLIARLETLESTEVYRWVIGKPRMGLWIVDHSQRVSIHFEGASSRVRSFLPHYVQFLCVLALCVVKPRVIVGAGRLRAALRTSAC